MNNSVYYCSVFWWWFRVDVIIVVCVRVCQAVWRRKAGVQFFVFLISRWKWKWMLFLCFKPETPAPPFPSWSRIIGCSIICTGFKTSLNQQEHVACNKHSFHQQNCDAAANLSLRHGTRVPECIILMSAVNNPNTHSASTPSTQEVPSHGVLESGRTEQAFCRR